MPNRYSDEVKEAAALWLDNLIYYQGGNFRKGSENFRWGRLADERYRHRDDDTIPVIKKAISGRVIPHNKAIKAAYKKYGDFPDAKSYEKTCRVGLDMSVKNSATKIQMFVLGC